MPLQQKRHTMSIKTAVCTKILDYLNVLQGYINTQLRGYYLQKNIEHAETFLRWFKSIRGYNRLNSAQVRPLPNLNCTHTKGGSGGVRYKDYNVHGHRFADGTYKIWCGNNCGFVSYERDSNWMEAIRMMGQSTNTVSSSERFFSDSPVRTNTITVTVMDKGIPNVTNSAS